ncbi:acyl carrier protein [Cystobacter fuscus]|uniref:acyl carrier protein n=1 Tax=Cystobacter fuscus TaxID=43 RepID=UPI002B2A58AD|nr:acyl carrier protein [Cystobacter fuscus]
MSIESVKTLEEIQARILSLLAKQLGLDARTLDVGESFSHYGLDSARVLQLLAVLGNQLGRKLPATLIWSYPNIAALARHLAGDTREPARDETALALRTGVMRAVCRARGDAVQPHGAHAGPEGPSRGRPQGCGRLWQRDGSRLNTTCAGVAPALRPAAAGRVGSDRCSTMAPTALGAVR